MTQNENQKREIEDNTLRLLRTTTQEEQNLIKQVLENARLKEQVRK